MASATASTEGSLGALVRRFRAARSAASGPDVFRPSLVPDLGWVVPEVGASKDLFPGAGAVVGMIRRAQASAGNLLRLAVVATVETRIHRAALTAWSAERGERAAQGRESAVFDVSGGRIASVRFHPENVAGDPAFWAAAVQRT